jgi:hypothetical protein
MTHLYNLYLSLHLIGATALFAAIGYALFTLKFPSKISYSKQAGFVALNGCFQLISGSLLAINSPGTSAGGFCAKIGIYVALIAITETSLYMKMKEKGAFPDSTVYSSLTAGIVISLLTVISL